MSPFDEAFARAASGLDWSHPCLIWTADYLVVATGRDPAESWRGIAWDEPTARHELARLAVAGEGATAVERALDAVAKRDGWTACDGPRQGAVMIGVYPAPDDPSIGIPAIFDGWRGWLVSYFGAATILRDPPPRIWEIAVA